jgi:hypothetical protein
VICEHGEPWWNDIERGKHLIYPPELPGNLPAVIIAKQGDIAKEMNFVYEISISYS